MCTDPDHQVRWKSVWLTIRRSSVNIQDLQVSYTYTNSHLTIDSVKGTRGKFHLFFKEKAKEVFFKILLFSIWIICWMIYCHVILFQALFDIWDSLDFGSCHKQNLTKIWASLLQTPLHQIRWRQKQSFNKPSAKSNYCKYLLKGYTYNVTEMQ